MKGKFKQDWIKDYRNILLELKQGLIDNQTSLGIIDKQRISIPFQSTLNSWAWRMATGWPEYEFVHGYKKPILFIGGHQLLFNRMKVNNDGDKTVYFYCVNKVKNGISCSASQVQPRFKLMKSGQLLSTPS